MTDPSKSTAYAARRAGPGTVPVTVVRLPAVLRRPWLRDIAFAAGPAS
ncbi:hypothetical protein ACGFSD_24590 [Streptomyces caniferus]